MDEVLHPGEVGVAARRKTDLPAHVVVFAEDSILLLDERECAMKAPNLSDSYFSVERKKIEKTAWI